MKKLIVLLLLLPAFWVQAQTTYITEKDVHYYPETDSLYIELNAVPSVETREIAEGVNLDLDAEGRPVGFDIDRASTKLDLGTLETSALPFHSTKAA